MPPAPHKPRLQLKVAPAHFSEGQVASLPAGAYVEFEVRDNGSGIKPEHLEKIWDPFFTTKKHGTGIGLATVLSIVRKLGGEIGLQSTVGVGTVFSVFLPLADQPVEVQARAAPSLRFGTGRVLFMDDDDHICSLTSSMLQSLDYKFDIAKNGDEPQFRISPRKLLTRSSKVPEPTGKRLRPFVRFLPQHRPALRRGHHGPDRRGRHGRRGGLPRAARA